MNLKEMIAKDRVCLALDVSTVQKALDLSAELSDLVGSFKVGKELHTAACNEGIPIVQRIREYGGSTFLDLKLHDTPNTVYKAAQACTVPGVYMFNVHIAGGEAMCKKAIEGAYEAAEAQRIERPKVIGVTVLTSLDDSDLRKEGLDITAQQLVMNRTLLAKTWGLDGVVCPAKMAGAMEKMIGGNFLYVTPGIEWKGNKGDGQKQLYTPDQAIKECNNSILVVGTAITKSEDKRKTTQDILTAMAEYL